MRLPNPKPKIKEGQLWRKKDSKVVVRITGKIGEKFNTQNMNGLRRTHTIPAKTLMLFWEQI